MIDLVGSNCCAERRCEAPNKTNDKDQIINSFENALQNAGKITPDKLSHAIDTIVRTFDENETEMICPYISKRIGIAEWIAHTTSSSGTQASLRYS